MRVPINDQAVGDDGPELFEKLELTTGESARLVIPVADAECVHVHLLEAPVVADGQIQWEEKTRKDKSKYQVYATTFVGRRLCLGDPDYMKANGGVDERSCPACAAAKEAGIKELVPDRRYAMPVIRITCTSKTSTTPQDPPGAKIYVLSLTVKQYKELASNLGAIRELYEWPPEHPVKPSNADLVLYCVDGDWKRYEWKPPMRPAWTKKRNPALNQFIGALWGNVENRPTDEQLRLASGRTSDLRWLSIDVERVTDAWAEVRRIERGAKAGASQPHETAQTAAAADGTLAEGFDDLDAVLGDDPALGADQGLGDDADPLDGLGEFAPADPAPANGHGPADSGADLVSGEPEVAAGPDGPDEDLFGDPEPAPQAAAVKPAAPKAASAAPAADSVKSFDDVLDDL
jgi:hypothetical protein